MRMSCTCRKKHAFFLALTLSVFLFAQAQNKTVSPKEKAVVLLKKNITASGLNLSLLNSYQVTDAYEDKRSGNFLVYLQQTYLALPVYNKIGVYVFRRDTLVQARPDFIGNIPGQAAKTTRYAISAMQAIRFAANHLSITVRQEPELLRKDELRNRFVYKVAGLKSDSTVSDLLWLPVNDGKELRLAWNTRIVSPDGINDWYVRIDAQSGEYLDKNSLVVFEKANNDDCEEEAGNTIIQLPSKPLMTPVKEYKTAFAPPPATTGASYRVYPLGVESGNFGTRQLETNPWLKAGAGNNAISLGWHFDNTTDYVYTRGNNVWAQEDLEGTDATTGAVDNSTTGFPTLTFDRTLDPSMNPGTAPNLQAGIDNVFYWNNLMHDISYQYGFDEAAGNFQVNNQGRGGLDNDLVNAFAEHGAGLNNANFSTLPDGQSGTMRMYQWNFGITTSFHINAPAAIAGDYVALPGSINLKSQLSYTGTKTASIVLVNDNSGGTHQGCPLNPIANGASLAGNIALIDRGGTSCSFAQKILNAQTAGAVAVIIANTSTGAFTGIGQSLVPSDNIAVNIPSVMISFADGNTLKANLASLNGTMSASGLLRDGALDNSIVPHEYTHGISNRLTGGPANASCLANAEQMGEGWSDYLALMTTTNWAAATATDGVNSRTIGTYAESQPANGPGIRRYPYSTNMAINPWTYGMMAGSTAGEAHTIGEIWCAAIWDMTWNIIQQEGIDADIYHGTKGNNTALQLVIEGMKYQPCSPGFLDARDAILKADSVLYNYAHRCAIWNAFARRGMGKSALQGSSNSYLDQTAATDVPLGVSILKTADKTALLNGDNITYTIEAHCDCTPLNNISIVDTLSSKLSYVTSSGGTYTAPVVRFDGIGFTPGETKTFTIQATVSGTYTAPVTLIDDSRDPANYTWTTAFTAGATNWASSATRSHSPSNAWFAADPSSATDFTLTSGNLLLDTISTLSFWHYFETDALFDGGLVEISTDAGATWKDLGPYMIENPYNNRLDASLGAAGNRQAFSGSSGGAFIQTIISLTDFAGDTVRVRFRFTSNAATGGEGWYIDDIVLKNEKVVANRVYAYNGASALSTSNTYALFTAVALPVHFNSFEALKQNNTAFLHWKVSDELNVDKYVIERSADGRAFSTIGEVAHSTGGGNEKDYYFTDNNTLTGNNFYRIAEKDLDGKATLSVTKLLRFTGNEMAIRLLPVPAYNHTVQLEIETTSRGSYTAYLLNTVGQVIKSYSVKAGMNQLDLQNFAKGIYYVKVDLGTGHTEVRKLVIE